MVAMLMIVAPCLAAEGASAVARAKPARSGMSCYMPEAASMDHLVMGCPVPGYHMRYDLAQKLNIFMVLLPDGVKSLDDAPRYFALDTLPFRGASPQALLDADFKGVLAQRPGTRVLKKLTHALPGKRGGQCAGLTLAYPKEQADFPYETYFICNAGSEHYALLLSLNTRSRTEMAAAMPDFMKWMDEPQSVVDARIYDMTGKATGR